MKTIARLVATGGVAALLLISAVASAQSTQAPPTEAPTSQAPTGQAPTAQPQTTQPPIPQPPATQPPATQPPATQPPTAPAPVNPAPRPTNGTTTPAPEIPAGVPLPAGYVIGPEDILTILFWRDKEMSGDVAVRPDGMISLPLIHDIPAAGLTPEQLRARLTAEAGKLMEDPNVTVVVKAIHSRKVFVTGQVTKPGAYPISSPTTVMQLLAMAGGVLEFADSKNIIVMRVEQGKQVAYRFNYKEVLKRRNLKQNIELKPGDTVVVP